MPAVNETFLRRRSRDDFSQVVAGALDRLQREHGYSRERATTALLSEILESAFGGEHTDVAHPSTDDVYQQELFRMMTQHGVTASQAHQALEISRAMDELCRQHPEQNAWQVLETLTQRLGRAPLLEHGASTVSAAHSRPVTSHIAPPTVAVGRASVPRTASSAAKKAKASKPSSRKRPFMDSTSKNSSSAKASVNRPRSDSAVEQFTAKKLAADSSASTVPPNTIPAAPKVKRPRLDETNTAETSNKRPRIGSGSSAASTQQLHE